jgi:hypothetical protein
MVGGGPSADIALAEERRDQHPRVSDDLIATGERGVGAGSMWSSRVLVRAGSGRSESRNSWRSPKPRRTAASRGTGPVYVYRCTVCGKTFERKSMDGSLNPHKHPRGCECPGRIGTYVRTKYQAGRS